MELHFGQVLILQLQHPIPTISYTYFLLLVDQLIKV